MVQKLLLLAVAGGLGTLARYGLAGLIQNYSGKDFPWGTVSVNLLGCFIFGILWTALENRMSISGETRAIILVGFMGAFTTFSTFVFETGQLIRSYEYFAAFGNLALQNIVGLCALFLGLGLGRLI